MKVTYKKLIQFRMMGQTYDPNTKLGYAIQKVLAKFPNYLKPIEALEIERNERINDCNIDFAETDDKGRLIYDITKDARGGEQRNFIYTKDGLKNRNKKQAEIILEMEAKINSKLDDFVEIDTYITDAPEGLNTQQLEAFDGIVLKDVKLEAV